MTGPMQKGYHITKEGLKSKYLKEIPESLRKILEAKNYVILEQ